MGGLLAFRVGNYDNTAEREQFRFLCEQLKAHYENSNEFCVFVGNYNIGCELDALFIKKDAIIAIEFKNYGGKVIANENGEWTCDGTTIKGGSRKTVLQQARINHSIVKKELKVLGVEAKQIKDVPTLVVFHQPIELTNNLSATNKSWLHITDDDHFIEKLDDITCPHTDLEPLGIVNLAELLNLNSFYLTEFSNANYDKPVQPSEHIDLFEDIKKYEHKTKEIESTNAEESGFDIVEVNNEETISLKNFVNQILSTILKKEDSCIKVLDSASANTLYASYGIDVKTEYLVTVESEGIGKACAKIGKFINHEVCVITPDLVCWEEGALVVTDSDDSNDTTTQIEIETEETSTSSIQQNVSFRKSKTVLPHWLDCKLFSELDAQHSPEHERYEYNLDLNEDEVKVYLGTYFPRSYAECFCTFDNLFKLISYRKIIASLETINVLDVGCGTGGELIGLLVSLDKHVTSNKKIFVQAIDGNQSALNSLEVILDELSQNSHHEITYKLIHNEFAKESDLNLKFDRKFDFILNSKVACELTSKNVVRGNAYEFIAKKLSGSLSPNGLLYILDVTTKEERSGIFYPQILNKGLNKFVTDNPSYSTLLPLACATWAKCSNPCFMQQTFVISHSRKSCDESRVCYRIICESHLKEDLLPNLEQQKQNAHVIHPIKYKQDDPSAICSNSTNGLTHIDSFNIKI